jgi:RNA polymerase sigma-70 factor (ECF subfamily)
MRIGAGGRRSMNSEGRERDLVEPDSDPQLVAAMARGERCALTELYDRHAPQVLGVCLRILKNRHDAEEVLVDVFAEIWEKAERYNPARSSVRIYLMQLARSRAIDRLRWNRSRAATWAAGGEARDVTDHRQVRPDERLITDEEVSILRAALESLTPVHQTVLEMAYFDGMSHREIADQLYLPLGTVKSYIRQGVHRLRHALRAVRRGGDR